MSRRVPILATIGQFATALTWPMKLPPRRVSAILATIGQFATALMWSMDLPPGAAVSAYPPAVALRDRPSPRETVAFQFAHGDCGHPTRRPKTTTALRSAISFAEVRGERMRGSLITAVSRGGRKTLLKEECFGPGIEYQPRTVAGGHLLQRHRVEA
jgi:hypothetical protein